jgi:hypothetical protein
MKHGVLVSGMMAATLLASATGAAAEGELPYEDLVVCAAFVMLESQAYGAEPALPADKAISEKFRQQSAALTMAAVIVHKRDQAAVESDVMTVNAKMQEFAEEEGGAEKMIKALAARCNGLGEAALEAMSK